MGDIRILGVALRERKDVGRMDYVEPAAVILLDDDDLTYTA